MQHLARNLLLFCLLFMSNIRFFHEIEAYYLCSVEPEKEYINLTEFINKRKVYNRVLQNSK